MFLSFIALALMCLFFLSVLALIFNCVLVSVYKRRASASDGDKKRYSIYLRQRKYSIIIVVVFFIAVIVVGVIGVNL